MSDKRINRLNKRVGDLELKRKTECEVLRDRIATLESTMQEKYERLTQETIDRLMVSIMSMSSTNPTTLLRGFEPCGASTLHQPMNNEGQHPTGEPTTPAASVQQTATAEDISPIVGQASQTKKFVENVSVNASVSASVNGSVNPDNHVVDMGSGTVNPTRNDNSTPKNSSQNSPKKAKASPFDGNESIEEYLIQFDIVSNINKWTESDKGEMLASLLRGPARSCLAQVPEALRANYNVLTDALKQRFGEFNLADVSHVRLTNRRQQYAEKLPEFAFDVLRLSQRAFPDCTIAAQNRIAMRHFINGIHNNDIQFQVRLARCENLNDALAVALEVEACATNTKDTRKNIRVAEMTLSKCIETQTDPPQTFRRRWRSKGFRNDSTKDTISGQHSGNEESPANRS